MNQPDVKVPWLLHEYGADLAQSLDAREYDELSVDVRHEMRQLAMQCEQLARQLRMIRWRISGEMTDEEFLHKLKVTRYEQ